MCCHLYSTDIVADYKNGLIYDCQTGDVLDLNLILSGYYEDFNNGRTRSVIWLSRIIKMNLS